MPPDHFFTQLMQGLTSLMTDHSTLFLVMGKRLFQAIAVMLFAWRGIQYALATTGGFRFDDFVPLVMKVAVCNAILVYYDAPIPGIGSSFSHLPIDQGLYMAGLIESETNDAAITKLAEAIDQAENPSGISIFDFMQVWRYCCTIILLTLAQIAMFMVISWGFIAVGVCVLVGPIFVPFFLIPRLSFLFRGWAMALLQYSFYPVVGNAVIYVFSKFILNFLHQHAPPWDASTIAGFFTQVVFVTVALIWGMFKIPSLVSSIFSGQTGEHAAPGIGWWR